MDGGGAGVALARGEVAQEARGGDASPVVGRDAGRVELEALVEVADGVGHLGELEAVSVE